MAINLSTAGIHLFYAVESTAGTRPTAKSAYTDLVGVKSTPDFNPAPDTLETTTLNETEWKTYIDGLKDPGGALEFNFNMTQELLTTWDSLQVYWKLQTELHLLEHQSEQQNQRLKFILKKERKICSEQKN